MRHHLNTSVGFLSHQGWWNMTGRRLHLHANCSTLVLHVSRLTSNRLVLEGDNLPPDSVNQAVRRETYVRVI